MKDYLKSQLLDLGRYIKLRLERTPIVSVWRWAEAHRRLPKSVTAKPGRYQTANAPYQKEPQESFTAPEVQTTVLYWAKRLGKTETLLNLEGSQMDQNPRNILHVLPTLDSGNKYSKQFVMPLIRNTWTLRAKIKDNRTRDGNNTILVKEFPGGSISIIGANSPSGFRQVQAPVVVCDEIDAMEDGPEGDPVTLAFGRAENYPDSIQVVSSTATHKQTSRIEAWWQKSDQRKWFVKSPCCDHWHVLAWANVKWPKEHKHEETYYECPNCKTHWNDDLRLQAIMSGEWRPTAPFKGIRGYWLNGLNTTFPPKKGYKSKLHQFAAEFHDAYTSGEAARTAWTNTFLCEPVEETGEKIEKNPLIERREDYTPETLPNEILVVGCSVDVQGDRLEYEIIGAGADRETWGIEYGKIIGNPDRTEVWGSLGQTLSRKFRRADSVELEIICCAIDTRHKGSQVRQFVRTCGRGRVYPVYGVSSATQSLLVIPHQNKHYRMILFSVNTDAAKDELFARLKLKDHGPGFMHYPKGNGYEPENGYFDQLTAEEKRIHYKEGFAKFYYWKDQNRRNEAIDLRVYFLTQMDILKPNFASIGKALLAQAEKLKAEKSGETKQPTAQKRPSFMQPEPAGPGRMKMTVGGMGGKKWI